MKVYRYTEWFFYTTAMLLHSLKKVSGAAIGIVL